MIYNYMYFGVTRELKEQTNVLHARKRIHVRRRILVLGCDQRAQGADY
jgi:hypothetical protein